MSPLSPLPPAGAEPNAPNEEDEEKKQARPRRRRGGRGRKQAAADADADGSSKKKGEGWTIITRGGARKPLPTAPTIPEAADEEAIKEEPQRIPFFDLSSPSEGGFIVGAGGRNTALVHKTTGVSIFVEPAGGVFGLPRNNADADLALARRMALSMASGGVLRWFVTPLATERGYPADKQPALRALANAYGCELQLLQSKRGHKCLLLVFIADASSEASSSSNDEEARTRVQLAREVLLAALTTVSVFAEDAAKEQGDAAAA